MSVSPKLKQLIGQSTEPKVIEVEKGQIRRFALAIGETDPIHFDEQEARAHGFASLVAPPTFAAVLIAPDVFLDELGWDPQAVMHRAEEYEYFRPICAQDEIALTHRVSDIYEQTGAGDSSLVFAVVETRAENKKGQPVFKGRRVLVKMQS